MTFDYSVIITGGTSGLGYHAASTIASRLPNCLIVLASRTDKHYAAKRINDGLKQSNVMFLPLDLSDHEAVRHFVTFWSNGSYPSIKMPACNFQVPFA
jgi:NAD(P)-dependent dehydrogenase (short-subunit alcohol dehydrogenase family)